MSNHPGPTTAHTVWLPTPSGPIRLEIHPRSGRAYFPAVENADGEKVLQVYTATETPTPSIVLCVDDKFTGAVAFATLSSDMAQLLSKQLKALLAYQDHSGVPEPTPNPYHTEETDHA